MCFNALDHAMVSHTSLKGWKVWKLYARNLFNLTSIPFFGFDFNYPTPRPALFLVGHFVQSPSSFLAEIDGRSRKACDLDEYICWYINSYAVIAIFWQIQDLSEFVLSFKYFHWAWNTFLKRSPCFYPDLYAIALLSWFVSSRK